ncbi:MAG: hypothetical protein ACRD22_21680 [Terriglobia bacterium]
MFEQLRYGGGLKGVAAAVVICALAAFWAFASSGIFSSGKVTKGVVLSVAPVVFSKVCGVTQRVASVQLAKGRVVQGLVVSSGSFQPGTPVTVRQQSYACNPTHYEVSSGE